MGFYEDLRDKTALPLIDKYGTAMKLVRVTPGTYDPVTGESTGDVTNELDCSGVFITFEEGATFSSSGQSISSNVLAGDRLILLEASRQAVREDDKLKIAGVVWTIISLESIAPGDVPVVYIVHVRN